MSLSCTREVRLFLQELCPLISIVVEMHETRDNKPTREKARGEIEHDTSGIKHDFGACAKVSCRVSWLRREESCSHLKNS